MYSVTLNVSACTLLLSSVATITILLRRRFRQWKNTSLYVLSVSDVLFSVFTCTILFVNWIERITSVKDQATDHGISDTGKGLNAATNLNDSDIIPDAECDVTKAMIEYGTLFLPFTNSFVSLLMFSVQCNLSVFDLKDECCYESVQSEEMVREGERTESSKGSGEIPSVERNTRNTLRAFKRDKTNKAVTAAAFVLSQWIVPVFVTGLLYLADFDENSTKEATRCSTESSVFLFHDCIDVKTTIASQDADSETHENPLYIDRLDEERLKLNKSNGTRVDEIIFKVQNLVYSLINDTPAVSFDRVSHDEESNTATRYFELDAYTILLERNESIENEFRLVNSSWAEHENSGDSEIYVVREDTNFTGDEYSLFDDLTTNISYVVREERYNDEIAMDIVEKLDTNESRTNDARNIADDSMDTTVKHDSAPPVLSSDPTFAEILERIHNLYHKYDKNKDYRDKKQPKEFEGKYSEHNISSNFTTIYQPDDSSVATLLLVHVADDCFVSTRFVKVHSLLLAFVIYLLPILLSSILQRRGKSICKTILTRLEARPPSRVLSDRNSDFTCEMNDASCELSMDSTEPSTTSKRPGKDRRRESIAAADKQRFVETRKDERCENDHRWNGVSFDENQRQSIIDRMENMSRSLDTIRKSTLCGTILWTPLFLEFLTKVFVSSRVPEWSLNVAYLTATLFGTLRNIFNLKMIKYQEANGMGITKINSVHPTTTT